MTKRKKQPRKRYRGQQQQQPKAKLSPSATPSVISNSIQSNAGNLPQTLASNGPANSSGNSERPPNWRFWFATVELLFAGAIVVATCIQAGVSYYQWDVMQRGLKQTDKTIAEMSRQTEEMIESRRLYSQELQQNRMTAMAKIVTLKVSLDKPISTASDIHFDVRNTGNTEATVTNCCFAVFEGDYRHITESDIEKHLKNAQVFTVGKVILAGDSETFTFWSAGEFLSEELIPQFKSLAGQINVAWKVSYRSRDGNIMSTTSTHRWTVVGAFVEFTPKEDKKEMDADFLLP